MDKNSRPKRGVLLDLTSRLAERSSAPAPERIFQPPPPDADVAPASGKRILGQRPDGTIDLASWRAKWKPIFKIDLSNGNGDSEGSLHFFHDGRSSSLEFMACDHGSGSIRHVLRPTDAMQLIAALNTAYGFDPKGPDGKAMSSTFGCDPDDGPGPAAA